MNLRDKFLGCLVGGAIGDAMGGEWENVQVPSQDPGLFIWGGETPPKYEWRVSDDTQMTLATCESIIGTERVDPNHIAQTFLKWYQSGNFSGLGSATLQALRGLAVGGHWSLVGKKGDRAAGNGAAMRIAPLAFLEPPIERESIRNISRITHHNEEAYVGALAIFLAIRQALETNILLSDKWFSTLIQELPDSTVKDRLDQLASHAHDSLEEVGQNFGASGYVAESVPLALFAVRKVRTMGFQATMDALISLGGDTDTNASLFGQVAGTMLGTKGLPDSWKDQLATLDCFSLIQNEVPPIHRTSEGEIIIDSKERISQP